MLGDLLLPNNYPLYTPTITHSSGLYNLIISYWSFSDPCNMMCTILNPCASQTILPANPALRRQNLPSFNTYQNTYFVS